MRLGKKSIEIDKKQRRKFIGIMASVLSSPFVCPSFKRNAWAILGGEAYAQTQADSKYFIEINLRDQWDLLHTFVPPGFATNPNLLRGSGIQGMANEPGDYKSNLAYFEVPLHYSLNQLTKSAYNNLYFTPDSAELIEHAANIAVLETCELPIGTIHGHEACNGYRSPGRSLSSSGGKSAMWLKDVSAKPGVDGNMPLYSSSPTATCIHNAIQKSLNPKIHNGITMKGIGRAHTVFHFAGSMGENAELDRMYAYNTMVNSFANFTQTEVHPIFASTKEYDIFKSILLKADQRYLQKLKADASLNINHTKTLTDSGYSFEPKSTTPPRLSLSTADEDYWMSGVPDQITASVKKEFHISRQLFYAFELIKADACRTVSVEFDLVDVHDQRTQFLMNRFGLQSAVPLARLIKKLKEANLFDKTVIVVNTLDGSRMPYSNSYGRNGKNSIVIIGSNIKGGYYGDIRTYMDDSRQRFSFHRPDENGNPIADGAKHTDNRNRTEDTRVYQTVLKAIGIPDDIRSQFPDAQGPPLDFMFNS